MEFRILGPLEVLDDEGRSIPIGGARQRALLAALLLHANEAMLSDRLIDDLWGDHPPTTGAKALQVAVSQLRKTLRDGALQTRPSGYLLQVEPGSLDAAQFERRREAGQRLLAAGRTEEAAAALREALALWRGPALADVVFEPFARVEAERLEELRLVALEERIDADLALGRHAELVSEVEALVARHPLRERLREQLMLALYRSGRQAEALGVFRETRRMLADELGLEPSPGLHELERAILRHDPRLEPTAASRLAATVLPPGRRRWAAAGAVVLAGAAAALALAVAGGETLGAVRPNSVGVIDPARNALVAEIPVGESPGPIAAGAGAVWVLNRNSRTLTQIDPRTRAVLSTSGVAEAPSALAVGDSLFVLDGRAERLHVLDPGTKKVRARFDLEPSAQGLPGADLAAWGDEVWATDERPSSLIRVQAGPLSSKIDAVALPGAPSGAAVEAERVWVSLDDGRLVVVDRRTLRLERTLDLGRRASDVVLGAGSIWVATGADGTVARLRARPVQLLATIPVGGDADALAFGAGALWVVDRGDGTVSRIDPRTNEVVATIRVGHRPEQAVVAGGLVWVSVRSTSA